MKSEVKAMLYRIDPQREQTRMFVEPRSKSVIRYFTKKEMQARYEDRNFNIIGEIGGFSRTPNKGDFLLADDGRKIPIHPRGSLIKPFEWVTGYVAVGKNTYLAAVRGLIPSFLRR